MSKITIHCWYGSKIEEDAIKRAGFIEDEVYDMDPMEAIQKLYSTGEVSVAIMKFIGKGDAPITIMVSDTWRFGQR